MASVWREGKPQGASAHQTSAYITPADVPLSKASDMAEPGVLWSGEALYKGINTGMCDSLVAIHVTVYPEGGKNTYLIEVI